MAANRIVIWTALVLWAAAITLSGLALMEDPTGDGFTRGLNRVTGFLGWQLAATIPALVLWQQSTRLEKGIALRWLARLPGWVALALFLLVAGWITIGVIGSWVSSPPATPPSPAPVTQPVPTE